MKSGKLFILCINQNKSLKKYTIRSLNLSNYKIEAIFMKLENSNTSKPHFNTKTY